MKRAAGVGLIYQNSILLAKRVETWEGKPIPLAGYWAIFSGAIESKESPMMCACRELFEESQIRKEIYELKFVKTLYKEDLIFHIYMSELSEMIDPVLNDEHTEYGWFAIDSLDNFHDKIDKDLVHAIKKYNKTRYLL
jgi:8-oxo-dGTP pyrophosphatase MutT (NUDIX family)